MSDRATPEAPPLSELAQSALLLAAISPLLLGLTALLALPVGVAALVEVRRSGGRLRGTPHALAAIIISLVVLVAAGSAALYLWGNPLPWQCDDCQPPAVGMLLDDQGGPPRSPVTSSHDTCGGGPCAPARCSVV